MNAAQLHLAVNHLPVVGMVIGTLVLVGALLLKQKTVKSTGLVILIFAALSAIPTYLSGEPTEDLVEHKPGVTKPLIHEHEEAAEFALVMALLVGAGAIGTTLVSRNSRFAGRWEKPATAITLLLSLATCGALIRTAHLGGLIRHDELRDGAAAEAVPGE